MMMNTTMEQLRNLRLPGMAEALQEQITQAGMTAMSFVTDRRNGATDVRRNGATNSS